MRRSWTIVVEPFTSRVAGLPSATIRIHEVEHFRGLDADGDGVPDEFKVSVEIDNVSCPA